MFCGQTWLGGTAICSLRDETMCRAYNSHVMILEKLAFMKSPVLRRRTGKGVQITREISLVTIRHDNGPNRRLMNNGCVHIPCGGWDAAIGVM